MTPPPVRMYSIAWQSWSAMRRGAVQGQAVVVGALQEIVSNLNHASCTG